MLLVLGQQDSGAVCVQLVINCFGLNRELITPSAVGTLCCRDCLTGEKRNGVLKVCANPQGSVHCVLRCFTLVYSQHMIRKLTQGKCMVKPFTCNV